MFARQHDPIVASGAAPGRGAVGIVRVSGKGLAPLVQALLGGALKGRHLKPREATYLPFLGADGFPIDQGLALWRTCQPLAGSALAYLYARRCRIPPADSHLRWHPHLALHPHLHVHLHQHMHPRALVCLMMFLVHW